MLLWLDGMGDADREELRGFMVVLLLEVIGRSEVKKLCAGNFVFAPCVTSPRPTASCRPGQARAVCLASS